MLTVCSFFCLHCCSWNKEKFEAPYFDDCDAFLTKLGLQFMAQDGELGAAKNPAVPVRDPADMSKSVRGSPPVSTTVKSSISSASSSASAAAASSVGAAASPSSASYTCPVCYDDFPLAETLSLGCGHRFCKSCFATYLVTAVNDGKLCIVSRCPGFKCPILVPDRTFKNLTESVTLTLMLAIAAYFHSSHTHHPLHTPDASNALKPR